MIKNKQKLNFVVVSILFLLLFLSIFWGYKNHLKNRELIKINQDLMKVIREKTIQKNSNKIEEGDPVPELSIKTIDNQNINISKAQTALFIFLDTSCNACIDWLFHFWKKVNKYQELVEKIIIIGLGNEEILKEFESKINLPIVLVHDSFSQLHRKFDIEGWPSIVFIKNGIVKLRGDPFSMDEKTLELINILKNSKRK